MNTPAAIKASLYKDWQSLVYSLGVSPQQAESAWLDVQARYESNGRYYHNLNHIFQVLETAKTIPHKEIDTTTLSLAIWFHDVIYNPQKQDNEKQSAIYAAHTLKEWQQSPNLIKMVELLILTTEKHEPLNPENGESLILLDSDLAILGTAPAAYQRYANAIRAEYSFVPEPIYRKERGKVLQAFLQRERIYFTDFMHQQNNYNAVMNLHQELNQLNTS